MLELNSSMFFQTLATARTAKVRTSWLYVWFWFTGLAKSPRVLRSSWILNEFILSEVCMIKTVPHGTISPQIWCINGIKGWFTRTPDLLARLCKVNLSNAKKIGLIFFPGLINLTVPLRLLNVIEDDCYFLGVHMRLSTRCKILFTLGLFTNYFSLKPLSLSLKSHMNVLCALKLTDWIACGIQV